MVDARLVVLVLGVLPFLAALWYLPRRTVLSHKEAVWGSLVGLIAFLGLGHSMATLLFDHRLLSLSPGAGEGVAIAILFAGVGLGLAVGVWLCRRIPTPAVSRLSWIAWGGVLYLGLHSLSDGLVLGESLVPGAAPLPVDGLTVSMSILHRFAEGSILVLPAMFAGWRGSKSLGLLSAGLLLAPAAFFAGQLAAPAGFTALLAFRSLIAGSEAGFAFAFILAALVPEAIVEYRDRWIVWAAGAFLGILLVHGLVE